MKAPLSVTIASVLFVSHLLGAEPNPSQPAKTRAEREFLKRFVGEWECTTEASFGPGKSVTTKGTMTAHMIGNFWVVIDRKAEIGGKPYHGRATYGFDSRKNKYIGTWTDSVSPILWHYQGDADENKLAVDSEGPHPTFPGNFKYRNTILKSTCQRRAPAP